MEGNKNSSTLKNSLQYNNKTEENENLNEVYTENAENNDNNKKRNITQTNLTNQQPKNEAYTATNFYSNNTYNDFYKTQNKYNQTQQLNMNNHQLSFYDNNMNTFYNTPLYQTQNNKFMNTSDYPAYNKTTTKINNKALNTWLKFVGTEFINPEEFEATRIK